MNQSKLVNRYRVKKPAGFRLASFDPADTAGLDLKKDVAERIVADDIKRLAKLQERLYAEHRWAVLVILQGVDAAGKDSAIKHVMSGINPQGCEVNAFKEPSAEERDHDFLWRAAVRLPRRGHIGIFNRSYYEEVLVVRVHKDLLKLQRLPPELVTNKIWKQRFKAINAFERYLVRNGIVLVKFHLRISREEQRKRLLKRLDDPTKNWKFSTRDVTEHKLWDCHMNAYEDAIRHTCTPDAPWYVVPSDNKWFLRLVVAAVMVDALEKLNPRFPNAAINPQEMKKLRTALFSERAAR
jgi:PPK2 family polyphosphate:nucleotide phosphotransferase